VPEPGLDLALALIAESLTSAERRTLTATLADVCKSTAR
jgi:hypothetical protein